MSILTGLLLKYLVLAQLTGHELYNGGRTLQIGHGVYRIGPSNNEPRGGAAMNENERNYSAYLQNAVNSAAPIARFSSLARSTPSISTYIHSITRRVTPRR